MGRKSSPSVPSQFSIHFFLTTSCALFHLLFLCLKFVLRIAFISCKLLVFAVLKAASHLAAERRTGCRRARNAKVSCLRDLCRSQRLIRSQSGLLIFILLVLTFGLLHADINRPMSIDRSRTKKYVERSLLQLPMPTSRLNRSRTKR
jgi:hypothetical protein